MVSGFKEGVGFAFRKCRECNATDVQLQEKVCVCVHVYAGVWAVWVHVSHIYSMIYIALLT